MSAATNPTTNPIDPALAPDERQWLADLQWLLQRMPARLLAVRGSDPPAPLAQTLGTLPALGASSFAYWPRPGLGQPGGDP